VNGLVAWYGYGVEVVCELVDLPRSSYYYHSHKRDESELVMAIEQVAGQYPTYGTRRIHQQLRRSPYGYRIGRMRTRRIMRQKGLLRPVRRRKAGTTNSRHAFRRYSNLVAGLTIDYPDQVWVSDITYIRLGQGYVYLAIVMDVFTRAIRGWNLSRLLDTSLTLVALQHGLSVATPAIHHSDQGIQYAAPAYVQVLEQCGIQISMASVGKPEENGYAERLMRTIKEEEVELSEYRDFAEAYHQIGRFIEDVYLHKRIHSALGYLTPVEFELAWRLALTQPEEGTP
jgi:transposase InsO family protein